MIEPLDTALAAERSIRVLLGEFRRKHAVQIRKRLFIAALNKGLRLQRNDVMMRAPNNKRGLEESSQVQISKSN